MKCKRTLVAPHVGAWIEIFNILNILVNVKVAPHVGAWIEMTMTLDQVLSSTVAPHVGAWIEIQFPQVLPMSAGLSHLT